MNAKEPNQQRHGSGNIPETSVQAILEDMARQIVAKGRVDFAVEPVKGAAFFYPIPDATLDKLKTARYLKAEGVGCFEILTVDDCPPVFGHVHLRISEHPV